MDPVAKDIQFSGLPKFLVDNALIAKADVQHHIKEAQKKKAPIISYLVENKLIDASQFASLASSAFGLPLLDLAAIDTQSLPAKLVSDKLIKQHHVLPLFKRGNKLFIAISDPTNFQAQDEIKFHTRLNIEAILVEEDKLSKSIEVSLEAADTSMKNLVLDSDLENLEISSGEDENKVNERDADIDDAPIVRYVNQILIDAKKKGASDIHLEPYEKNMRIRFRTDGILTEIASLPSVSANRIISRIKVMSKMDIAERRVPQDGRIKVHITKQNSIDFRVNTCPTQFGEKVVMRLLDATSAQIGIEKLGFEPAQQKLFLEAIHRPYGMVLVTGPTGSGKTVTLYTGLNLLNSSEVNISTAEDPVEITVPGINQVNVNPKTGLTFAEALRAFLRQDPDIIMVGEIRDLETAEIAVKAAQTGHMVLSTLHTNDAPQTLNRLLQMGIPAFNIVSAVNLIMAQRLARRLCEHCKQLKVFPEPILLAAGFTQEQIKNLVIYGPTGCDKCTNGYKGRVGIYQVMAISPKMRELILQGGNTLELAKLAKEEGINDLRASGLLKVSQGITSLEEVDRVTKE